MSFRNHPQPLHFRGQRRWGRCTRGLSDSDATQPETWVDSGWQSGAHSIKKKNPSLSFLLLSSLSEGTQSRHCVGGITLLLRQNRTEVSEGKPTPSRSDHGATDNSVPPLSLPILSLLLPPLCVCNSVFILVFAAKSRQIMFFDKWEEQK